MTQSASLTRLLYRLVHRRYINRECKRFRAALDDALATILGKS